MDEIPEDIIRDAARLGEEVAEEVVRDARYGERPTDPQGAGMETVERIAREIDYLDPDLAAEQPLRGPFPDLTNLFATYVAQFINLVRDEDGHVPDELPLLRVSGDDRPGQLVPIDTANERAAQAVIARARGIRIDGDTALDFGARPRIDPRAWPRLAETIPFVEMRSVPEAGRSFFSLFTISYWMGRRSVARTGQSTVNFTVDCSNHGYQLEYWPQFLFTPTVFGGNLTRPVSATVPINYYHFQGWLNNAITPDGGLYPADANNTHAMLRAF